MKQQRDLQRRWQVNIDDELNEDIGPCQQESLKIPQYDLNGERDFLIFNITKYQDEKLNRIGSEKDEKVLEKTLRKKGFKLRASINGEVRKKAIVNKMKQYLNKLKQEKRDIKVLVIAFMAHGSNGDNIVFSDSKTCGYKSLLQMIFKCKMLRGIPKVIINQFCRGSFNMNTAFVDGFTENDDQSCLINGQADLVQCFATVEGNKALRQKDGSPFIKELCFILNSKDRMMQN